MSSENNITTCDLLEVTSRRGEIEAETRVSGIEAGNVFTPFHFAKRAAHVLTYSALDPAARTPELKIRAVKLSKLN